MTSRELRGSGEFSVKAAKKPICSVWRVACCTIWLLALLSLSCANLPAAQQVGTLVHQSARNLLSGHAIGTDEASLETTVVCVDKLGYNQTCYIKNLYIIPPSKKESNPTLAAFILKGQKLPQIRLQLWGGPVAATSPVSIKAFPSEKLLKRAVEGLRPKHKQGLHLIFTVLDMDNWVSAVFDGLYAACVGLAKFDKHMDNFSPVVMDTDVEHDCVNPQSGHTSRMKCDMEQGMSLFASWGKHADQLKVLKDDFRQPAVLEEVILGSSNAGQQSSVNSLPNSRHFPHWQHGEGVMRAFIARFLSTHGIAPSVVRHRSDANRTGGALKAVISKNEGFSEEMEGRLRKAVDLCSSDSLGAAGPLHCSYVDLDAVTPFKERLRLFAEADVHVTGPGATLFNSLFLPDGSVTVNLGAMAPMGSEKGSEQLPQYGEEVVGMSHVGARVMYLPLEQVRRGPTTKEILHMIHQAARSIKEGFELPTRRAEESLSILGQIVYELTMTNQKSLLGLSGLTRRTALSRHKRAPPLILFLPDLSAGCPRLTPADIVYETSASLENCRADKLILRKLKKEHRLREALGLNRTDSSCWCVVCAGCSF